MFKKPPKLVATKDHRFAVMISARNESTVIADLVGSIRAQNYPQELIDIFVVADNCTDDTAAVARTAGAIVFERDDLSLIGKGYGLDFAYRNIIEDYGADKYDAYFVFDADNVLDVNYFKEMNATFSSGALVSTSYRNSKNYDSNWISAGYAIWFLRESKFLNQARFTLNTSCTISGTGFYIASSVLNQHGGWTWHLLTEDIEFSAVSIIDGVRIAYTPTAMLYDEQPLTFKDSWNQRFRWAKGFYQVLFGYGARLATHIFTNPKGARFACYDLFMTIAPGMLLTLISVVFNAVVAILAIIGVMPADSIIASSVYSILFCLIYYLLFMFVLGILTTVLEWNNIRSSRSKKIRYIFTFPIFMFTYIPIALIALVKKAEWKQITHTISVNIEDFSQSVGNKVRSSNDARYSSKKQKQSEEL